MSQRNAVSNSFNRSKTCRDHCNVLSNFATVGVAKSLLHVEGLLSEKQVRAAAAEAAAAEGQSAAGPGGKEAAAAGPGPGSESAGGGGGWLPLVAAGGEVLGAAVCVGGGGSGGSGGRKQQAAAVAAAARRPIYVSLGHMVSLETAVEIVRRCCRHRVPEPIRQADLASRERVRALLSGQRL